MKQYFYNIAYAIVRNIDIFFNALTGGDPRETISSRMGKLVAKEKCVFCMLLCSLLNKIDPNHCQTSIDDDVGDLAVEK